MHVHVATVSQKEEYSRNSESEKVSDMQRTLAEIDPEYRSK